MLFVCMIAVFLLCRGSNKRVSLKYSTRATLTVTLYLYRGGSLPVATASSYSISVPSFQRQTLLKMPVVGLPATVEVALTVLPADHFVKYWKVTGKGEEATVVL